MTLHTTTLPQELVYFLHIPKTAGTTFRAFLEDHYHSDTICPHWLLEDILKLPPRQLNSYQLICGHYAYYIVSKLLAPPSIVTMLRDPIDRTISHFYHIKNTKDHWFNEEVSGMSLDDFLNDPIGISEILNFQTRFIAFDNIQEQNFGFANIRNDLNKLDLLLNNEELLNIALNRMRSFRFVGITERFDESLTLLSHEFGWPAPVTFPKYNVAPYREKYHELSESTLHRIKELNRLDLVLYETGKQLFEQRFSQLTQELTQEYYEKRMSQIPRTSNVFLDFKQPIWGAGWLVREFMDTGKVHRWTGPGDSAFLDIPLSCDNYRITFYAGVYVRDLLFGLKLYVNGRPIPLSFHYADERYLSEGIFHADISKEIIQEQSGFTRFTFSVPDTIKPVDVDSESNDTRSLGIYFKWIDLAPHTS